MRTFATLVIATLIALSLPAQDDNSFSLKVRYLEIENQGYIQMGLGAAKTVDFWARKGLSSVQLIEDKDQVISVLQESNKQRADQIVELNSLKLTTEQMVVELKAENTIMYRRVTDLEHENAQVKSDNVDLKADVKRLKKFKRNLWITLGTALVAGITFGIVSG